MNNQNTGNVDNNQSLTVFSTPVYTPDQYFENLRKIEGAQQAIQEVALKNEAGLRNYIEDQKRKVAEGQAAL